MRLPPASQYEAYQPMAEREIHAIIRRAREKWSLRHVAIAHRTGVVPSAESSVEIAISSEHRREALAAVQFAIDELKAQVPIWKKEIYAGEGGAWKENKESAAPTLGHGSGGSGGRQRSSVALSVVFIAGLGAVVALTSRGWRR